MTKNEIVEAINATIAPNNVKGITAESLANILTEMVNATPEGGGGSGDGALRVIVPELMMIGPEFISIGEFSPTSWEAIKSQTEASAGLDLSEYDVAVNASFVHNANVVQQILEKARAGQGVSVVLDQKPYTSAYRNMLFQIEAGVEAFVEEMVMSGVQPAGLSLQYIELTPEGEASLGGDVFNCILAPTGYINDTNSGIANYPSDMTITLNLDGSLTFTQIEEEQPSSGSGVVTFYFATNFTDEIKAKNKAAYETYMTAEGTKGVVIYDVNSGRTLFPVASYMEGDVLLFEIITTLFSENNTVESLLLPCHPDGTVEA